MSHYYAVAVATIVSVLLLAAGAASANCGGDHPESDHRQTAGHPEGYADAAAGGRWHGHEEMARARHADGDRQWMKQGRGERRWAKQGKGDRQWRRGKNARMRHHGVWRPHRLSPWLGQSHLPYGQKRWHIIETSGHGDCVDLGPYAICRDMAVMGSPTIRVWDADEMEDDEDNIDDDGDDAGEVRVYRR